MQINKIILCSDQHLRLFKRHAEYEQVFKRFYKFVDSVKDDETIIVLGGDLVHNKIEMTPELIQMSSNFLKECADRCPTILMLGNHDFSPNAQRLDALTPIVDSLNHPNLHFWKKSGIYRLGGIVWSNFSLWGSPDEWITADKIKAKTKIALFHGPVLSNSYNNQYLQEGGRTVNIGQFKGFDMVMLGDIHISNQLVQEYHCVDGEKYPLAKYPGSLICQSYGESPTNHGVLVFDVKNRTSEFVEIENDFCYYTLNIENDKFFIPKNLPKKVRLRVKYENSKLETVNEAMELFSKRYSIVELIKYKSTPINSTLTNPLQLGNSRNVDYQNQLLEEYLTGQSIDIDIINEIKSINVQYNKTFQSTNIFRNITWKPLVLEFSNMFSYGENNTFDFTDLNGSYSISAKNFEGKSAFLEILCFVIYDKSPRVSKAIHILNNTKNEFYCKFSFEFNGQQFFIERIGVKNQKNNTVRVDVNFWTLDENGELLSLNGDDRDQTNKVIREYLGTYDDFIITALSTQYDNQSFVDKTQRERKELLYKFLDISIYDDLYKLVKDTTKEQQALIRENERENLYDKSSYLNNQINENQVKVSDINSEIDICKDQIKTLNNQISSLNKQFNVLTNTIDIKNVELQIKNCKAELQGLANDLTNNKEQLNKYENEIKDRTDIDGFVYDKALDNRLADIKGEIAKCERKLFESNSLLETHNQKVSHLNSHEYDPNCKFCCNNEFVIDAKKSIELIPNIEVVIIELVDRLSNLKFERNELETKIADQKELEKQVQIYKNILTNIQLSQEKNKTIKYKGQTIQERVKHLEIERETYYTNEKIIIENAKIEADIKKLKTDLSVLEKQSDKLQTEYRSVFGLLSSQKSEYDIVQNKIQQYNLLIKNNRIYELYTQALGRDGIPYLILEKILPVIEFEVNQVLSQVVNFTVKLESTEEKYIHAFINYNDNQTWPVELTSGMERFILSLAFRTSLTEITSLPRPSFLAIDEGFGVLDTDNLLSMGKMFEFLKTRYNYLLIITHIESMKDLVEKRINVQKINGYSTIQIEEK